MAQDDVGETSEAPPLAVETVAIADLSEDPANARAHNERNIESIKASLRRFGQQKPIVVDPNGVVRAGNGLLRAAKDLGWTHIAIVRTQLTGSEATAYGIADNRTGELSEWEFETLAGLLRALRDDGVDLKDLGWEPHEVEPLLQAEWTPPDKQTLEGNSDDGEKADPIFVTKGQRKTIERAIAQIRTQTDAPDTSEGRAVELVAADWLAGQQQ